MVRIVIFVLLVAACVPVRAQERYRGFGPGFVAGPQSFAQELRNEVRLSYGTYRLTDSYGPVYGYEGYYPRPRRVQGLFGGYYPRYRRFHRAGYTF
jgi:hypothetical protein